VLGIDRLGSRAPIWRQRLNKRVFVVIDVLDECHIDFQVQVCTALLELTQGDDDTKFNVVISMRELDPISKIQATHYFPVLRIGSEWPSETIPDYI
jgi:hypothetical protein